LREKAVSYLRQAGTKAFARSSNREALACFEQALSALGHLPETRETLEQGVDVRFELRHAMFPLAEFDKTEKCLKQAEILATTLGDQKRLGWVWGYMCTQAMWTGRPATEVDMFAQRVNAIGATLGDAPLQVAGHYYPAIACFLLGDYHGTERHCRTLMQLLEGDRSRERFSLAVFPAVLSRFFLARALAERGAFDEGEIQGREAIRIAEALDHPFSLIVACLFLAYVDGMRGETSQSARMLERAVALGRDWNITTFAPIALTSLGHAYARSGRFKEGVSLLQEAITAYECSGIGFFRSISDVQFGEVYLAAGQVEDARACADRALTLARQRGESGHEAWALRLLGEIASHENAAADAEAHYGAALALATELGMRPLQAHCNYGLAKLHSPGDRQEALKHLRTAIVMYSEMNMQFWMQKARTEMDQLG
jgi:tetratricopeptide (TPR) repeat protein